jgi:hypothetical protein
VIPLDAYWRVPAPGLATIKADQPKIPRAVASVSAMDTVKKNHIRRVRWMMIECDGERYPSVDPAFSAPDTVME